MNSITIIQHSGWLCFHGEDSADFTGSKQSDDIQCQKSFEQFAGEWNKVDAQSSPLRQEKQYDFVVTKIPQRYNTKIHSWKRILDEFVKERLYTHNIAFQSHKRYFCM